jgi:hypothetical protein
VPADDEVGWTWTIGCVAKEFGVLPSVAEREIMNDPEGRALELLTMFSYAQLKQAADAAKDEDALKPYAKSKLMKHVKANISYFEHRNAHKTFRAKCPGCIRARAAGEL